MIPKIAELIVAKPANGLQPFTLTRPAEMAPRTAEVLQGLGHKVFVQFMFPFITE
ncbi:MAG: hypothetical protein AB9869_04725 [Verrucomicrobiia bacterium]